MYQYQREQWLSNKELLELYLEGRTTWREYILNIF